MWVRPNPLIYPVKSPAGFDPSHIASKSTRVSAVAQQGNLINLLSGRGGTIGGTPSGSIFQNLGPVSTFSGSSDVVTFAGQGVPNDAAVTIATIVQFDALGSAFQVMFVSSQTGGQGVSLYLSNVGHPILEWLGGGSYNSNFVLTANVPYFLIASGNAATSVNFLFKQLDTGQIVNNSFTTGSATSSAGDGTYQIGNNTNFGQPTLGKMAAIMYSGAALSSDTMLAWAQSDPWSYWYPRRRGLTISQKQVVGTASTGSVGAATGTGAAAGIGASLAASVGASAGVGAAAGVGKALFSGVGSAAGTGAAAAVGASTAASPGSSAGTGVATGVGASTAASVGASSGTGAASGIGSSLAASVGNAAGTGTALGIAPGGSIGAATGTGAAAAVGSALSAGVGSSAGIGTASAIGAALSNGVGSASGIGAASGVGVAAAIAVGTSAGTGAATAVGAALSLGVGSASGLGTALGVSTSTASVGNADGVGIALGIGAFTGSLIILDKPAFVTDGYSRKKRKEVRAEVKAARHERKKLGAERLAEIPPAPEIAEPPVEPSLSFADMQYILRHREQLKNNEAAIALLLLLP